jgi:hypothetical protein
MSTPTHTHVVVVARKVAFTGDVKAAMTYAAEHKDERPIVKSAAAWTAEQSRQAGQKAEEKAAASVTVLTASHSALPQLPQALEILAGTRYAKYSICQQAARGFTLSPNQAAWVIKTAAAVVAQQKAAQKLAKALA